MKKKQLLARIEQLEQRITAMELRQHTPVLEWPAPTVQPYLYPWIVTSADDTFRVHDYTHCGSATSAKFPENYTLT